MFKQLFSVALLALIGSSVLGFDRAKVEISLKRGLENYLETGEISEELNQALEQVQLPQLFRRGDGKGIVQDAACTACNVGLGVLLFAKRHGAPPSTIEHIIEKLCVWLKIESEKICHATIRTNIDTFMYIIDNKPSLTAKTMCSILLQNMGCKDPDRQDWSVDIPAKRSVKATQKSFNEEKALQILQITDLHYDPAYQPGSNAACDEPVCCQRNSKPENPENAAGYWGDFRFCDTPWHAFIDALDHITSQHRNLDYIYFTGDIINHKVWDTDIDGNCKAISDVLRKLKEYFGNVPIYPILGNHEPHPVNVFSSEGVNNIQLSTQWVFDLAAEEWRRWLPKETEDTILRGGYYTVLVRPGFRVIALNSNVCYTFNWWLFYDDVDPFGQLQWLVNTLLEAEENGEIVHVLSHVPSGDSSCLQNWSKEYARIIDRFSHIISAQFNGHTHNDDTVIFFNTENPSQAINVAFNGGSLTTYSNLNPNYKIYQVDPNGFEVLDYESWAYGIPEANMNPILLPNWYKLYSFKQAYQVESLQPQELANLAERMTKTPTLTEKYFRFKNRESDAALVEGCDRNCEIMNLCYMVTFVHGHSLHCDIITELYNTHRPESPILKVT